MFYIKTNRNKYIKCKNVNLSINQEDGKQYIETVLETSYLNYFNADIKAVSLVHRRWFKESNPVMIDDNYLPTYQITNNILTITFTAEGI